MKAIQTCLGTLWALGLLLAIGMPAKAASPAGNLGGTAWTTVIPPNPEYYGGAQRVYIQIHRNGTYNMFDPPNGDYASAGIYNVTPPNRWSLRSTTNTTSDHGTYRFEGRNKLVSTDQFGVTRTWTRLPPPFISQRKVDGVMVPVGVPQLLRFVIAVARKHWHRDEIATALDVSLGNALITLYSPSSRTAVLVSVYPYWTTQEALTDLDQAEGTPIPTRLFDMPQVLATARRDGLSGKFGDALLMNYSPRFGSLWLIRTENGGGYFLPSGAKLRGITPEDIQIARENKQWENAIKNIRAAIQRMTRSGCPPHYDYNPVMHSCMEDIGFYMATTPPADR